jgi:putative addiction module killer protein
MAETKSRRIIIYQTPDGGKPYELWFAEIKNKTLKDAIDARIERVKNGNFGDCKSVGDDVKELRFRAFGVRVYFAEVEGFIVLLLCAGDKSSQPNDIRRAKGYWSEFQAGLEEKRNGR